MSNKTETMNGGRLVAINYEPLPDGSVPAPEEIRVRQIPVRDYERGFPLVEDEPALVAFLAGKPKDWALTLDPASFELVLAAGREVNSRGFFSVCQRRMELADKRNAQVIGAMATLPPETVRLAMELGMAKQNPLRSPTLSPGFALPPGR